VIVIDASALVKLLLKEEGWEEVVDQLRLGALSLDLAVKEAANAICFRLKLRGLSLKDASELFKALKTLAGKAIKVEREEAYLDEAVEIALKHGVTVYDALYIALAKSSGLKLLTADKEQANIAELEKVPVILLS